MSILRLSYRVILTAVLGAALASCGSSATPAPTATIPIRTATATARASAPSPMAPPAERSTVVPMALGGSHTCALTAGNGVLCWGNNRYGQLGNGTFVNSGIPAEAARMTSGIISIAAGTAHTCALRAGGGVECWGINTKGQLGDSTNADSRTPVAVDGLSAGVKALTAGDRHTCVLMETGAVKCWGENASGGLGDGTSINRNAPADVSGMTGGVTALDAGAGHTCALMENGAVECWGWNISGQLGNGTAVDSRVPVEVSGLPGPARAIAAGDQHTCALLEGGSVMCWGANSSGQLGNGTRSRSSVPVAVAGLSEAVEIAAGGAHTCALQADDAVKCWGDDQSGQLGDGGQENRSSPVAVGGLPGAVDHIAAGFSHTCASLIDRRILCWGWNTEGQLGDGTTRSRRVPGDVLRFTGGVAAVSMGWSNTCALLAGGGGIRCWGLNGGGQLGNGGDVVSGSPVEVNGLGAGRISVTVGGAHVCALSARGGVKCWGRNDRGQLGNGNNADQNNPVDVAGLPEETVAIAAGSNHTCALTVRGGVKCWGANESGQLGNGAAADSAKPVDVTGLSEGVAAIAAGGNHACALTFRGGMKCWGSNKYGQLGDGTLDDRSVPVDVGGLTADVDLIAAGGFHTCAIVSGVTLKCWGWNAYGQLGDSTPTDRPLPANVLWLAGTPASVSAGYDFTCAVMRLGNLRCWGNNEFGQLGDGSNTVHHTPVDVHGPAEKMGILAAGYYSACAVTVQGRLTCWGNNLYGQLGDGGTTNSNLPLDVAGLE
jgi:alpha-tubulin suppressor-like RCC1 family protein